MKKPALIALAVAIPAVAYPAASWLLGKQVESALDDQYKQVESLPYLKVVKRDYQRGVFSADETITFEAFGDMFRALSAVPQEEAPDGTADEAAPRPPLKPLQFTLRTHYQHGPFPGGSHLAAAVADSELELGEGFDATAVLGDKKPMTAHTIYGFGGGGSAAIDSPAFAASLPNAQSGSTTRLAWEGITAKIDFSRHFAHYTLQATAPKLEIHESSGPRMVLSGMKLEADNARIFDDEPLLYAGTQHFTLEQFSIEGEPSQEQPVLLKRLSYDVNAPVNGDFLDLAAKMGAENLLVAGQDYGPVHYDFSFKHLHTRTVAQLYRTVLQVYSDPAALAAPEHAAAALAPLSGPALELLKHNPEFSLDRISFKSAHGEAVISARAKLNDVKPEDVATPFMLIGKLEASADLTLPEGLLINASAAKPDPADEYAQMQGEMRQQQLTAYAEQGYVTREGGTVKSRIEFRNGQLTVNGKPFNPMAMPRPEPNS